MARITMTYLHHDGGDQPVRLEGFRDDEDLVKYVQDPDSDIGPVRALKIEARAEHSSFTSPRR